MLIQKGAWAHHGANVLKLICNVLKCPVVLPMAILSCAAQLVNGKCCKETCSDQYNNGGFLFKAQGHGNAI